MFHVLTKEEVEDLRKRARAGKAITVSVATTRTLVTDLYNLLTTLDARDEKIAELEHLIRIQEGKGVFYT